MNILKNYLATICFSILSIGLLSCEDDKEKIGVAVESIEAEAGFDLSNRSDWVLLMGGYVYDFTVSGNKLKGSFRETPYYFSYGLPSANGSEEISLFHPNYLGTKTKTSPPEPRIIDQSTLYKLTYYDPLRGPYIGDIVPNIKNITLYHFNALLSFRLSDIPKEAKVTVRERNIYTILPLQDEEDKAVYKAIVSPSNRNDNLVLIVEVNGKTYETIIRWDMAKAKTKGSAYHFDAIGDSSLLTFTARIDAEDKLVIEDMEIEGWSTSWPISQ